MQAVARHRAAISARRPPWGLLLWAAALLPATASLQLPAAPLRADELGESGDAVRDHAGDFVVLVRRADLKVESNVVDTVEEGVLLGVDRVDGDWLWVTSKKSGWLHRSSVIPARKAIDLFTAALRRAPGDGRLYARRGVARALNLDFAGALKDYNEAIRLRPAEAVYYGDRGCMHLALGDPDKAIADFREEARRIESEDESRRAIRLEWLQQRLADAEAAKAAETTVTLDHKP